MEFALLNDSEDMIPPKFADLFNRAVDATYVFCKEFTESTPGEMHPGVISAALVYAGAFALMFNREPDEAKEIIQKIVTFAWKASYTSPSSK